MIYFEHQLQLSGASTLVGPPTGSNKICASKISDFTCPHSSILRSDLLDIEHPQSVDKQDYSWLTMQRDMVITAVVASTLTELMPQLAQQ